MCHGGGQFAWPKCLASGLGSGFGWLGGRLSRRVSVRFGVRLLFGLGLGLGGPVSLLLLPMGHCCSMRGIQQMPLNPKHLLFPWVLHPHLIPPAMPPPRLQPPGRHNRGRAQTPAHQAGGQVTHPPPRRGAPRAAFAAPASPSPSHGDGEVPSPTTSCCPIRRTCTPVGASCFAGVWGGARQGVWVSRRGRVLLGRRCGGWPGWGGSSQSWTSGCPRPNTPPTPTTPGQPSRGCWPPTCPSGGGSAPTPAARTGWHTPAGG